MAEARGFSLLERFELKYHIPVEWADRIGAFLAPYCEEDYYSKITPGALHFDMRTDFKTELAEPFTLQHHSRHSLIPVSALLDHLQIPCRFCFLCHRFAPFCRSRLKIKEAADT